MRSTTPNVQVTLSGFSDHPDVKEFICTINQYVGEYSGGLNQSTAILCITSVGSEKYKIAKLKGPSIQVVTKQWIVDCHQQRKKVDPAKYEIKSLLYGLKDQVIAIREKVESEGGECEVVDVGQLSNNDSPQCVLISNTTVELPDSVTDLEIPVVSMDWYEECLVKGSLIFPIDRSINCTQARLKNQVQRLFGISSGRVKDVLRTIQVDNKDYNIFGGDVFYVHGFDQKSNKAIKQVISAYGGFYLDQFTSINSHVVAFDYSDDQLKMFMKYGNFIKIIRLSWLIDCVLTGRRIPEDNYLLEKSKIRIKDKTPRMTFTDSNSFSFGNRTSFNEPTHSISRKGGSISMTARDRLDLKHSSSMSEVKSTLFKGKNFFFLTAQKNKQELKNLPKQIKEYSGHLPRELTKSDVCYLVMADCKHNPTHYEGFKNHFQKVTVVSYRWVNHCMKFNQLCNPEEKNRFIFKPINMETPVAFFLKPVIDIIGFDQVKRARIRQLLNVIGNVSMIKKKESVSHVICEPHTFKTQERYHQYQQLLQDNPKLKIRFVQFQWILDSMNSQKLLPVDKYEMKS